MDTCTESISVVWMAFIRSIGFSVLDIDVETRLKTENKIEECIHNMQLREQKLTTQLRDILQEGRKALGQGNRPLAATFTERGKRVRTQIRSVQNMMRALDIQKDSIENTELNNTIIAAFKESSNAFTSWRRKVTVTDIDEVDSLRQDIEDGIRAAHELTESTSIPLVSDWHNETCVTEEDLERELNDLDEAGGLHMYDPKKTEAAPLYVAQPPHSMQQYKNTTGKHVYHRIEEEDTEEPEEVMASMTT